MTLRQLTFCSCRLEVLRSPSILPRHHYEIDVFLFRPNVMAVRGFVKIEEVVG